jgi:hypothetical protein
MPKARPGSEVVMPMRGLRQQELSRRWRTMLADGGSFGRREQACAWCSRPANKLQSYFSHHPSTAAMGEAAPGLSPRSGRSASDPTALWKLA